MAKQKKNTQTQKKAVNVSHKTAKGRNAKSEPNQEQIKARDKHASEREIHMPFSKQNYYLLLLGLFFIAAGFLLMTGGGSEDSNVFNDEMFNFRRLTLAPIMVLLGYIIEIFAIMYTPKKRKES